MLSRDRSAVLDRGRPLCWAVAPSQALSAARALLGLGWTIDGAHPPRWSLAGYIAGAHHLILRPGDGPRWLLSWGLDLWPGTRALTPEAAPRDLGGRGVLALAPRDALCFALWQPGGLDAFALAAQLLTIAAVDEIRAWPEAVPASTATLPAHWEDCLGQLRPLFAQWGAPAAFGRGIEPARGPAPPRNPLKRLATDWHRYRVALAERGSPAMPLPQLPGYLMGRWHLRRPQQLLWRALGWLFHTQNHP